MKLKDIQYQVKYSDPALYEHLNLSVLSNITLDPYLTPLVQKAFAESCIAVDLLLIRYEDYKSYTNSIAETDILMVLLNIESMLPGFCNTIYSLESSREQFILQVVNHYRKIYNDLKLLTRNPIIWFGFEDYCYNFSYTQGNIDYCQNIIDEINHHFINMLDTSDVYIDTKHLIAKIGIMNAYDVKSKYRWNAPYSQLMVSQIANEIYKQYLIQKGTTKKCVVLDCDNVLWGGIISEDGIENIRLGNDGFGRPFLDFQNFLLSLYYHGVILTVCSKNDLTDVMRVFREHSGMKLKEEHIACFQVNWNNKIENIKKIAEILNIGLDSMVFVDDSNFEIEAVKKALPEVTSILFECETVYKQFSCFNLKKSISLDSVIQRNNTYKTNQQREVLKMQCQDFIEYLDSLEIKIDIHKALSTEYARIAELTQRTNKCTNGIRYTVTEIINRIDKNDVVLYSLFVTDHFSDLGLVGAFEIEGDTLTLFSLSCRALGREIEKKMITYIAEKYQVNKIRFKYTGKNEDVKILLLKAFEQAVLTN